MGHWSEQDLADIKRRLGIGGDEHDEELLAYLQASQEEIERLAGRRFDVERLATLDLKPNGLPFLPVDDLHVDRPPATDVSVWPIPDPVHPEYGRVLQVIAPYGVAPRAGPLSDALAYAARFAASAAREGAFTDTMARWLAAEREQDRLEEVLGWTMDPASQVHVPVARSEIDGWWIQFSRRLFVVKHDTPDDVGLVEVLIDGSDKGWALVASEPLIIIARRTEHPTIWAMPIRVWISSGTKASRTWSIPRGAEAIHRYGLPVVSLDGDSTAAEATAQLLLAAFWHGYLDDSPEIPMALVSAFGREVGTIRRGTGDPDDRAAATRLFERLFGKGFDPSCSAETMRHYVRHHARTIVRAHRASQRTDQPWQRLGISEGYYYKLLRKKGVVKGADGRFVVNDAVLGSLRDELEARSAVRTRNQAAIELLEGRGFSKANARKWLQRHPIEEIAIARPREGRG